MTEHAFALPPGFLFEDYEIVRVLGVGGFGITYLAFDDRNNEAVAIKEYLPGDIAARPDGLNVCPLTRDDAEDYNWGLERFLDEARILAHFHHPNIVKVSRFFRMFGSAYIVMEYAEGETLAEFCAGSGQLSEDEIKSIIGPVLEGLGEVHRKDFLHRDIKPGNIILREEGGAVLLDFGAARHAVGVRSQSVVSVVTPGYAPIEQYSTQGNQGPWSDIYAMGAVIRRCILCEVPPASVDRAINDRLEPLATMGLEGYSMEFLQAVDKALQLRSEDRPQLVHDWYQEVILGYSPDADGEAEEGAFEAGQAPQPEPPAGKRRREKPYNVRDPFHIAMIFWAVSLVLASAANFAVGEPQPFLAGLSMLAATSVGLGAAWAHSARFAGIADPRYHRGKIPEVLSASLRSVLAFAAMFAVMLLAAQLVIKDAAVTESDWIAFGILFGIVGVILIPFLLIARVTFLLPLGKLVEVPEGRMRSVSIAFGALSLMAVAYSLLGLKVEEEAGEWAAVQFQLGDERISAESREFIKAYSDDCVICENGADANRYLARLNKSDWVVAADGTGDSTTIQEALNWVPESATINIRPGHYQEALTLDFSVNLEGRGARDEIIIETSGDAPTILALAGSGRIANLTIRYGGESTDAETIRLAGGKFDIVGNRLVNPKYGAVVVGEGEISITRNQFEETPSAGLMVLGTAVVELEGNIFSKSGLATVWVTNQAQIVIGNNRFSNPGLTCLVVQEQASGTIANNVFTNCGLIGDINSYPALWIGSDSQFEIRDNQLGGGYACIWLEGQQVCGLQNLNKIE